MTVADLIAEIEAIRPDIRGNKDAFVRFNRIEKRAARTMARAGVFAVRVGATFYVRYNDSLTVYPDVPEAACLACELTSGETPK